MGWMGYATAIELLGREFQLFLIGYIIVSICEIFTVGGFPLDRKVRLVCSSFMILACCGEIDLRRDLQPYILVQ